MNNILSESLSHCQCRLPKPAKSQNIRSLGVNLFSFVFHPHGPLRSDRTGHFFGHFFTWGHSGAGCQKWCFKRSAFGDPGAQSTPPPSPWRCRMTATTGALFVPKERVTHARARFSFLIPRACLRLFGFFRLPRAAPLRTPRAPRPSLALPCRTHWQVAIPALLLAQRPAGPDGCAILEVYVYIFVTAAGCGAAALLVPALAPAAAADGGGAAKPVHPAGKELLKLPRARAQVEQRLHPARPLRVVVLHHVVVLARLFGPGPVVAPCR